MNFQLLASEFWNAIKATDHKGRIVTKGNIVYDSDSDDFDTRCIVADIMVMVFDHSCYECFFILVYEDTKQYRNICRSRDISINYGG